MKLVSTLLYIFTSSILVSGTGNVCRCIPGDHCWPNEADWSSLNQTLDGALIRGVPPGSACYPEHPNYNPDTCTFVASQWFNSAWHASDPVSINYPIATNNSCNPIWPNGTSVTGDTTAGARGCLMGAYPAYVVNATTPEQISVALKWAKKTNIRIVVKSTGHSYAGRSVGYGSLSIWTHHLRGIEYIEDFQPTSCAVEGPVKAARVAAGHTVVDVLLETAKHDAVAITGANPSVGIVGWLTGGGHGPLTQTYGMGVDHLLEATIVTSNGDILLTNACKNPDLFFAMRGGGGGTFGVVTEMVVKVYPSPRTTSHTLTVTSLASTRAAEFYDFLGFIHAELQRLKEGGMQGYYYILGPPSVPTLSFAWRFMAFDKPDGTIQRLMQPIEVYLDARTQLFAYDQDIKHADTYLAIYNGTYTNEPVATGGSAYGSRLMSPESLANANTTAHVLAQIGPSDDAAKPNAPSTNPILIGHMIAPPHSASHAPSTISATPAWRSTLVHLLIVSSFPDNSPPSLIDSIYSDITHNKTAALRKLSPGTGAYFNEADKNEVGWQQSFWGEAYERLRKVKRRVDPGGVMWCRRCVGSEEWEEREDGTLCLVKRGRDEL